MSKSEQLKKIEKDLWAVENYMLFPILLHRVEKLLTKIDMVNECSLYAQAIELWKLINDTIDEYVTEYVENN